MYGVLPKSLDCHPERSEGSRSPTEILHFVQNDKTSPPSDSSFLQDDVASRENDKASAGLSQSCNIPHTAREARTVERNDEAASRKRPGRTAMQAALVGLLVGLGAYLIFGLTDAITLGAKPTVVLWLMVGLVEAARRGARDGN